MFDLHCAECDRRYLVGPRSILAFANSDDGPRAAVRCPVGHVVIERFGRPARGRPTVDVEVATAS